MSHHSVIVSTLFILQTEYNLSQTSHTHIFLPLVLLCGTFAIVAHIPQQRQIGLITQSNCLFVQFVRERKSLNPIKLLNILPIT